MTAAEKQLELKKKMLMGLEKVYERFLEFKKQKNAELVIMQDDKIVKFKPGNNAN